VVRARAASTSSAAALLVAVWVTLALIAGHAAAEPASDRLATSDPRALAEAVTEIEHGPADAPALYAAGRACEDTLLDPVRALALYDRLLREHPDANVATAAEQHGARLREQLGAGHAREAQDFARLVAEADRLPIDDVVRRGDALATTAWPGAAEVELWLADWLRRAGRFDAADARYTRLLATWPAAPQAKRVASGRAGAALDARAWDRARVLIDALPAATPEDIAVRDDLRAALARGVSHARFAMVAWISLVLAFGLLVVSLVEAALRGGARRPSLVPPIELWFLGPVALVLAGVAFTAHQAIAPVVLRIALAGIAFAWISGATLDLLRARGRAWKARAGGHVALCALGVVAVAYLALAGAGLLDLF
jgi:hypothetical protein